MKGRVKWFNDKKGYGFITGDDGKDYFVHYSAIADSARRKTLTAEEAVEFEATSNEKGPCAKDVKHLDSPAPAPTRREEREIDPDL